MFISLVRKSDTVYVHAESLADNPEFAEMLEEDTAGPDEFIAVVQEPVCCTELGVQFRSIWSAYCHVFPAGAAGRPRGEA